MDMRVISRGLVLSLMLVSLCSCGKGTSFRGFKEGDNKGEVEFSKATDDQLTLIPRREDIARIGIRKGFKTMPDYLESDMLLEKMNMTEDEVKKLGKEELKKLETKGERLMQLMSIYSGPKNMMPKEVEYSADAAIWRKGYYYQMGEVLKAIHEPYRELHDPPETKLKDTAEVMEILNWNGIASAGETPLVILPTGSLRGIQADSQESRDMRDYVEKGGVIFVMGQPFGTDFAGVPTQPGDSLEAVGYCQDVSTNGSPLIRVSDHPMVSCFSKTKISWLKADGIFYKCPKDSIILFRRSESGMPCAFLYPLGKGWVVVTSICLDEENFVTANSGITKIMAGLMGWIKSLNTNIQTVKINKDNPDGEVKLNLSVKNTTGTAGNLVQVAVKTPERNATIQTGSVKVSIPAGGSKELPVTISLKNLMGEKEVRPGTYHVDYRILMSGILSNEVIQPWAESETGAYCAYVPADEKENAWSTYFAAWCDNDDPDRTESLVYIYVQDLSNSAREFRLWGNYKKEPAVLLDQFRMSPAETRITSMQYGLTRSGSYHFFLLEPQTTQTGNTPKLEFGEDPWPLVGKRWIVMNRD